LKNVALQQRLCSAIDVGQALMYLHSMQVMHRDVKTSNYLLCTPFIPFAAALPTLKLGDLGLARWKANCQEGLTKCVGTLWYMAPELFFDDDYDQKIDVFAYGIALYEFITGQWPYSHVQVKDECRLAFAITKGERPVLSFVDGLAAKELHSILANSWDQSSSNRPSMDEMVAQLQAVVSKHFGLMH